MSTPNDMFAPWMKLFQAMTLTPGLAAPAGLDPMAYFQPFLAAQKSAEDMGEAWLKTWNLVPRGRYLELLEENHRLRRRIAELETRRTPVETTAETVERAQKTMETAFQDVLQAQRRWVEMFSPPGTAADPTNPGSGPKSKN